MPIISVSDLRPIGSELFHDSESYMNELGASEVSTTNGGSSLLCVASASSYVCYQSAVRATQISMRSAPPGVISEGVRRRIGRGNSGGGGSF